MVTKSVVGNTGAPRWTYVAGVIVAIAGLGWTVVSYFIAKPEAQPKPPAALTAPAVSVSGNGSVGVGTMSGGQISVGSSPIVPTPAASTPMKAASSP